MHSAQRVIGCAIVALWSVAAPISAGQGQPPYAIADLEVKTLAAKPGRYFGRCALERLRDGTWFLVYHESGHHSRYEPGEPWAYLAPNGDLVVHSLKNNFNTRRWDGTWQTRSSDGGRSWTRFERIDFRGIEHDEFIWAIDDHFVHEGVIYMGAREVPIPQFWKGMRNLLVKSTDSGRTWELVSHVTKKRAVTTEQGIEYLGGRTILCVLNSVDRRHTWLT